MRGVPRRKKRIGPRTVHTRYRIGERIRIQRQENSRDRRYFGMNIWAGGVTPPSSVRGIVEFLHMGYQISTIVMFLPFCCHHGHGTGSWAA